MIVRLRFVGIVIASLILAVGCSGTRKDVVKMPPAWEDFDPGSLDDNDIVIRPDVGPEENTTEDTASFAPGVEKEILQYEPVPSGDTLSYEIVDGYRVQIFAGIDRGMAERVKGEALEKLNVGIYVEYDPPLYRVRIGDCRTVEEVQSLTAEAKLKGYSDAFWAPTQINVTKEMKTIKEEAEGFRIQIMMLENADTAQKVRQEAEELFNIGVYVDFEPAFYKVRIGDFTDRFQAEVTLEIVRSKGYRDAFVVTSKVWVERRVEGE